MGHSILISLSIGINYSIFFLPFENLKRKWNNMVINNKTYSIVTNTHFTSSTLFTALISQFWKLSLFEYINITNKFSNASNDLEIAVIINPISQYLTINFLLLFLLCSQLQKGAAKYNF